MKTLWIVDDDEEMARAIQLMLQLLKWESCGFFSARAAARSLLDGKRPDLLILDINMPEVSGMQLLEFIRKRKDLRNMPVIMLSTETSDHIVDQARAIGADAYLTKPVAVNELEASIKKAFQMHGIEMA